MSSPSSLKGQIIRIHKGLAIYQINASPFWYARVRDSSSQRNIVRSTKETSRLEARKVAEELYASTIRAITAPATARADTFGRFADELITLEKAKGQRGELHVRLWTNTNFYLNHHNWGINRQFDKTPIADIRTTDYLGYLDWVRSKDGSLKPATMNHLASAFSKVMKLARDRGAILAVPALPRVARKDRPRPFFRFVPLVSPAEDEYEQLLRNAQQMAVERVRVRETVVTDELHDLIVFLTQSFVRPVESELYGLKHRHVSRSIDPPALLLTMPKGKTGFRVSTTMPAAVAIYDQIVARHPKLAGTDDYLFFPQYRNRSSAKRIAQRQFNALLKRCDLKRSPIFDYAHSLYSLRHTAICMRLTLSKGQVNIYTLAKNAGTSVDQIERFYARHLPLSAELVRNLQSFGD